MARVTSNQAISLDGYSSGPHQTVERPFGEGQVAELTRWMFDDAEANAAERADILGADVYVMGRNMFGPDRGAPDLEWTGWWGAEPPYRAPVLVLTHHAREPLVLGATTFTFVTGGVQEAHARAQEIAGEQGRVHVSGGATTVRQFLAAGLIDELRVHVAPVILGAGERPFDGVPGQRLEQVSVRATDLVTHITYRVLPA